MASSSALNRDRVHRKRRSALALALIGAGLIVIGGAAALFLAQPSPAGPVAPSQVVPLAVDYLAPDLALSDLQGRPVSLADYGGQVVLINNWATWCPPCREEMPTLQAYYQDHQDQGFVLVAISAGDSPEAVAEFVDRYSLTFPVWMDPRSQALEEFRTKSLPSSFLVDRRGQVVRAWAGAISRGTLEEHITRYWRIDYGSKSHLERPPVLHRHRRYRFRDPLGPDGITAAMRTASARSETFAVGLAGCTAMDVISILEKKRRRITAFEVQVHAGRAQSIPRSSWRGHRMLRHRPRRQEEAVVRAIGSATRYCPAQGMLHKLIPMQLKYHIFEENPGGEPTRSPAGNIPSSWRGVGAGRKNSLQS
jgi:peroxiredoxin